MKAVSVLLLIAFGWFHPLKGQNIVKDSFGKGIKVTAADSSFHTKFGFRFQTLYVGTFHDRPDGTRDYRDQLMTRRSRLKFDGFAFDPSIVYKVELAVSNRDHRSGHIPESGNTANIVLDAVVKWNFAGNWNLWFGQTKLPGNRERVISSQKLQFVDRSLVNSRFNLDRDMGVQLHHKHRIGSIVLREAVALSMGEGRNIIAQNPGKGHQLTGRLEILPFGDFTSKGDYFGSDLKREPMPKLSIGLTGDMNYDAARQRGNLGSFQYDTDGGYIQGDLKTFFADMMCKYKGFSVMSEYANRMMARPSLGTFGIGEGLVVQGGYLLPSNLEFALRYTDINAIGSSSISDISEFTFGVSRYVVGHSLKVQSDLSFLETATANDVRVRFQVEVAL